MQIKTKMPFYPSFYTRVFMRTIIIHDQEEVEFRRSFVIDFLKESDELLMPMAWYAVSDNRPSSLLKAANRVVVPWRT